MLLPRVGLAILTLALFSNMAMSAAVPIPCEAIDSVGTAKMRENGTITLRLRTLWPQPFAESLHVYAPNDPQYGLIKRHLGGISPGETKPVPPLCGMNSEP